ncbi:MAG: hypothetical protein HQL83_04565 [Magnetococcales bacterium]|nr:hypothetical protein [Magnetococcales bacterium]
MSAVKPLDAHYIQWHARRLVEAVRRFGLVHRDEDGGFLIFLFARHWLIREVHPHYRLQVARALDTPERDPPVSSWLLHQVEEGDDAAWIGMLWDRFAQNSQTDTTPARLMPPPVVQGIKEQRVGELIRRWRQLGLFMVPYQQEVRRLGAVEREVMRDLGGADDRERIGLIDSLQVADQSIPSWAKMALIPRLACPESCRHCMFIWRPPMKHLPDPGPLLATINQRTANLLFTGGDLTGELDLFHHAIATMDQVETFAILLNGQLAHTRAAADDFFAALHRALARRPRSFARARVVVQISLDEYHQEILANRRGELRERIPVAHVARLLIAGAGWNGGTVALVHKQNSLNFSTLLFQHGVLGRLAAELELRGWNIGDVHWLTSPRSKEYPAQPGRQGGVIREAQLSLVGPATAATVHFISSCIDAMGRAELMDRSEYVHEPLLLESWLQGASPVMDPFDTDPMLWRNGNVTLFGAIHLWMGHFFEEGDRIFTRWHKDPLVAALARMDLRVLTAHQAWNARKHHELVQSATSPHGLMHAMTRDSAARLFLTRWLLTHPAERVLIPS